MPTTVYPPGVSGLLLVNPYNDILSEGGKLWPSVKGLSRNIEARPAFRTPISISGSSSEG